MTSEPAGCRYRGFMGHRFELGAVVPLLAALISGCTGGSAGDPGVSDWISVDPPPPATGRPPGGPCDSPNYTASLVESNEQPRPRLRAISEADGLWLDVIRGAVVDVSSPARMRIRSQLQIGELVEVVSLGERRVAAGVRRPDAYYRSDAARAADELVVLGFENPDQPTVLSRAQIPGDIAAITLGRSDDGLGLYVVSDEVEERCIGPTKQSFLRSFRLDGDALSQPELAPLGDSLTAVAQRGDRLVLLDGQPSRGGPMRDATLRVIALGNEAGLTLSEPLAIPAAPEATLVWLSAAGGVLSFIALGSEPRIARYDVAATAPRLLSSCTASVPASYYEHAWAVGERFYLATWPAAEGSGPITNRVIELGPSCELLRTRNDLWLARVPGRDHAVELDWSNDSALEARLVGPALEPVSTARVEPLDAMSGSRPYHASVLSLPAPVWSDATVELGLLSVPLGGESSPGQLQLFSVSERTITARGTLLPAPNVTGRPSAGTPVVPIHNGVALLDSGEARTLSSFELGSGPSALPLGTLTISPEFSSAAWLNDRHVLRVRLPLDWKLSGPQELSRLRSTLEVIEAAGDPEHTPAAASIELEPNTQVVQAGAAFWLAIDNDSRGRPGQTRIALHDFTQPTAPRARGVLTTDSLWVQDNEGTRHGPSIECLTCDQSSDGPFALATERALVIRGYTWIAEDAMRGHSGFTFQVVDLSDPDAPKLGPSFEMPREDHGLGARLDGSIVHYWYKRPAGGGSSRYFVRRLDVSAPSTPQLSEPILVPGELLAVRGGSLYTRELVRDGELRAVLHHVQIERDRARIVASQQLGEPRVTALRLDGAQLYVDLGERLGGPEPAIDQASLTPPVAARLLVLDANDLERIAEGDVAIGASQLAVRDGVAWYAAWGGLLRIDALDPENVDRRQFTTFDQPVLGPYVDLKFAGGTLLLVDRESNRLRLLDR